MFSACFPKIHDLHTPKRTNRKTPLFCNSFFGPRIAWRRAGGALRGGSRRTFSEQSEGPKGEPPKAGGFKVQVKGKRAYIYIYIIIACFFWLRFQKPKDFRRIGEGSPTGRMVHGAVGMDERNGMIFSR